VVSSLNDLATEARAQFLQDMNRIGDALLKATGAFRINYEILGNTEPDEKRHMPAWFYDWKNATQSAHF